MKLKIVENMVDMVAFLNNPDVTGAIVSKGDTYGLKPDALYLGIYEGWELVGVFEVRQFWQNVIEVHGMFKHGFRGCYALESYRLLSAWLIENNPFTNSVTMVPDNAKFGRSLVTLLGATRIGVMADAFFVNGEPVSVTLYQMTRQQVEKAANVNLSNRK